MRPALLKLATWNVGGGILGESHQRDGIPSLDHHASVLEEHAPDVVCLQETHDYHGRREGQSEELARRAGYPYAASFPVSPSHMAEDASLALGVLSRFPLADMAYKRFPHPPLRTSGPRGERWTLHDKGYVVGSVDLGGRRLGLLNGHLFPLRRFGVSPMDPEFARMREMLTEDLLGMGGAGTAFAGLDANYGRIGELLADVVGAGGYRSAFEGTPTTPKGVQQDHILYGHGMRLLSTTVAATESDHAYCQVSVLV
ncbi:endonuclease/exonuclease/phosphatase family protein [Streptomyces sp. LMG1-1-1.1]|uniref:endonuclease/exonuclease/phosphatase family protein n=1 Tax=Streptomyces sp. LMG1-1-1.1 TaxID=3135245 RepID=UPI0034678CDF